MNKRLFELVELHASGTGIRQVYNAEQGYFWQQLNGPRFYKRMAELEDAGLTIRYKNIYNWTCFRLTDESKKASAGPLMAAVSATLLHMIRTVPGQTAAEIREQYNQKRLWWSRLSVSQFVWEITDLVDWGLVRTDGLIGFEAILDHALTPKLYPVKRER